MKIISLVPSFTETLFALDLGNRLAGRTRFCERPEGLVKKIRIVGGTKNPNIRLIRELQPALVIANKEENRREDIEKIREFTRVHLTDVKTVEDALSSIGEIGRLLDRREKATDIVESVRGEMRKLPLVPSRTAVYLIWREPWMTVGGDTYIHDVMRIWGFTNLFASATRYPVASPEQIAGMKPDYIFLSSEPFPFKKRHIHEMLGYCPDSSVLLVDGQWFSWYGSRMESAFGALNEWRASIIL